MNKKRISIILVAIMLIIFVPSVLAYTITGQVKGQGGIGIQGAHVSITDSNPILVGDNLTDINGTYIITIPDIPDLYTITVDPINPYSGDIFSDVISADYIVPDFNLAVIATYNVLGKITDMSNNPLNGVNVNFYLGSSLIKTVTTDINGDYSASLGDTITYNVEASEASYDLMVQSVTLNGADQTLNFVLLPACADADLDSFKDVACGGNDCNDNDNLINPNSADILDNSIDENCNGINEMTLVVSSGGSSGGGGGSHSDNHPAVVTSTPVITEPVKEEVKQTSSENNQGNEVTGAATVETGNGSYVIAGIIGLFVLGIGFFIWKKYY